MLSNNDMLRIHYKKSYKYRELWKERIISLVNENKLKKIKDPVLIEALYIKRNNKTLDYDSSISCLKYIIDGFVKSGILEDDCISIVPYILTKTIVDKSQKFDSIILSIKEIDEHFNPHSEEFNKQIKRYQN